MLEYFFLFTNILFGIFVLYFIIAFLSGAPFVPTTNPAAKRMIELSRLTPGMTVYDLGSGDGRLLKLAEAVGANPTGFEINPFLVLYANLRGAPTKWGNFWNQDLSRADVLFVYLLPWKMERLARKIARECRPNTIIVSNSFIFPSWKIVRQDKASHIYVFRV